MNQTPAENASVPASHLEDIRRKEAALRLSLVRESIELRKELISLRTKVDKLNNELGERNAHIHKLNLHVKDLTGLLTDRENQLHTINTERLGLKDERIALQADLEQMAKLLQQADNARLRLERKLHEPAELINGPVRAFQSLTKTAAAKAPFNPAPAGRITYHLATCPYRIYREPRFTIRGWCAPTDGRPITAVRARINDAVFLGSMSGARSEETQNPSSAEPHKEEFEMSFDVPVGRSELSLEARLGEKDWFSFLSTSIWSVK